jgi:hypothetical protein
MTKTQITQKGELIVSQRQFAEVYWTGHSKTLLISGTVEFEIKQSVENVSS